ncbi:MFS transporter [Virgisporangium aliadipatigenens]|nr:MFS transporter [Virgisporangium aliadipatigenens]
MGALIGLCGGTFLYTTAEALPVGLLLPMATDLAVSPARVGALVTAYGAVVTVASVPLAALVRGVPRRRLLTAMLAGFVASSAVTLVTDTFALVLAARIATAATHALFWAVVVPAAAELFRPGARGRVVALVFAGGNVALFLGVPLGTWLGERAGWRAAFLAMAAAGAVVLIVVAALLPATPPEEGHAARGEAPDGRRFGLLVAVAAVTTTGAIAAYTYVALFVTEVSGFAPAAVAAVLVARGVASLLGVGVVAAVVDRGPWTTMVGTVAVQAVALVGLFAAGRQPWAAVALIAVAGLGFAGFTATLGGLVLRVAPGRSDLAGATVSAAVNVGIAGGAFAGGLVLPGHGPRGAVLVGAVLVGIALALALCERRLDRAPAPQATRPRSASHTSPSAIAAGNASASTSRSSTSRRTRSHASSGT